MVVETQTKQRYSYASETEFLEFKQWTEALRLCVSSLEAEDIPDVLFAIVNPLPGEQSAKTAKLRAIMGARCLADEPEVDEAVAWFVLRKFVATIPASESYSASSSEHTDTAFEIARSEWREVLQLLLVEGHRSRKYVDFVSWLCGRIELEQLPAGEAAVYDWFTQKINGLSQQDSSSKVRVAMMLVVAAEMRRLVPIPMMFETLLDAMEVGEESRALSLALYQICKIGFNHSSEYHTGHLVEDSDNERFTYKWLPSDTEIERTLKLLSQDQWDEFTTNNLVLVSGNFNDPRVVLPLLDKLYDKNEFIVDAVFDTLRSLTNPDAIEAIFVELDNQDEFIRGIVCQVLAEIGDPRAADFLIARLDDGEAYVRACAAYAMGKLQDPSSIPHLRAKLYDQDETVRDTVRAALTEIDPKRNLVQVLSEFEEIEEDEQSDDREMEHYDEWEHDEAMFHGPDALHGSMSLIRHEPPNARSYDVLRMSDDERQLLERVFEDRICDDDPQIRSSMITALGPVADDRAVALVMNALNDKEESVRRAALGALLSRHVDDVTKFLISSNSDGESPWIDPRKVIDLARVNLIADALSILPEETMKLYDSLATQMPLTLSWRSDVLI